MANASAAAGVYDHGGWAVVVCVAGRRVIDRRRIELVEPGLPSIPHHHEAQKLPLAEAVTLVERVRASAQLCAQRALAELPPSTKVIAIRKRPKLPPSIAERITNTWAQNRADWVMYRDVIAEAAQARGWLVSEYDTKTVLSEAAQLLGVDDISGFMNEVRKSLGPPWAKDHRLAMAAALVAGKSRR